MIIKKVGRYTKKQKRRRFILKLLKGLFNTIVAVVVLWMMGMSFLYLFGLLKYL